MTMMKTTLTKLLLLVSLLYAATSAHAAELVISGGDGNPDILRYEGYNVGLQAIVTDPPTTNEEVEITGPTYLWSGGGSGMKLTTPTDESSVGLDALIPANYGGGGQKDVPVSCTATYTSKNKKTGVETPIPVPKSKTVRFFVRVPDHVEVVYGIAHREGPVGFETISPVYNELGQWGSADDWHLRVKDNRNKPYEYCDVTEVLTPPSQEQVMGFGSLAQVGWRQESS